MTRDVVRRGVQERLDRLGVACVDLLQFHWWSFEHPAWLDALHEMKAMQDEGLIRAIGVTNFDAAHLALALADGIPIATNQVSFSLVDRRAAGDLAALCKASGVRLLAYGTLCGGFLSEKWLGKPEPAGHRRLEQVEIQALHRCGGRLGRLSRRCWPPPAAIARKHGVSISNVATRWVLEHDSVAAVIIGARLGENEHRDDNLQGLRLHARRGGHARCWIRPSPRMTPIPGDCGDEYRKPPFLTASGDLSHHLCAIPSAYETLPIAHRQGLRVSTGSVWEPIAGYSRAVRVKDMIFVSGTTATHASSRCVAPGNAGAQADLHPRQDRRLACSRRRTHRGRGAHPHLPEGCRQWEPVSRAHGRVFGKILPANTLIEAGALVGDYEVEIEADAIVGAGPGTA